MRAEPRAGAQGHFLGGRSAAAGGQLIVAGEGAELIQQDGKRLIDCTAQAWTANLGFNHPDVLAAVREQLGKVTHVWPAYDTEPTLELTARLADLAPGTGAQKLDRIAYCLVGSLAVEGAMKLALRAKPGRVNFVSLWDAYHGRTMLTLAASWPHPAEPFRPFMTHIIRVPQAYCYRCPFQMSHPRCELFCVKFAEQTITQNCDAPPAAVLMEPIQGNGGMICFPPDYHQAMLAMCRRLDTLLIYDEIQTAFGRVGTMFAAELYGIVPDIIAFGKALGGGLPVAGFMTRKDLDVLEVGDHAFTFGHFPLGTAGAVATLKILQGTDLLRRCGMLGQQITARLRDLQDRYELIGEVRGPGLMIGIELVRDRTSKIPAREQASRFVQLGLEHGVIFGTSRYGGRGNVVKIKPPLVITDAQVQRVMEVFAGLCEQVSSEMSRRS